MTEALNKTGTVIRDGSYVVKKYDNLSKQDYKILRQKLEIGKGMKPIEGLVTPIDFITDGNKVKESYYPYVEGINFADYINKNGVNLSLDIICDYIHKLENLLKKCHCEDIILPDFLTGGNLLYNPITKKINAVDYDGMQVKELPSFGISDFIYKPHNIVLLRGQKYYRNGLYTKNIDVYSLYIAFFYYTTKFNIPNDPDLKNTLYSYLKTTNLLGTTISKKMLDIYNLKVDNSYFDEDILKIGSQYELSNNMPGMPRVFIRK